MAFFTTALAVGTAVGLGTGLAATVGGAAILGSAAYGVVKGIKAIGKSQAKKSSGDFSPMSTGEMTTSEVDQVAARKRMFKSGTLFTSPTGLANFGQGQTTKLQ